MKKTIILLLVTLMLITVTVSAADTLNLTVQQAVTLTLQNNPQLQQVLAKRDQVSAQVGQAEASNWPTVTLSDSFDPWGYQSATYYGLKAGTGYPSGNYTISGDSGITNGLNVAVQYPLFTGGAITYGIKQAKAALDGLDQQVQLTRQQLKYNASSAYYTAVNWKNQVVVAQSNVDTQNEHLRVVNAQYNAGVVAKSDVLQTQSDLAKAMTQLITAQNSYAIAILALKTTMNISLGTDIVLAEDLNIKQDSLDKAALVDYALKNRPDYLASKIAIQGDEYALKVSEAGYYPTIALGATYSNSLTNDASSPFKSTNYDYNTYNSNSNQVAVSANLQYNVFDGFLVKNQVKAATAQIAQDQQASELSRLQVILQVNQAIDQIGTDLKLIAANKAYLDYATENYKINVVQYASGVTTNLNVMTAQSDLANAQSQYWNSLYSFNKDTASLALATGVPVQ
ncbi:MAG: TolC family protein [Negativicutes bacterium]|jgi:outer membrane protein TolC